MNTTQANATFTTLSDTQYVAINVRNSGAVGDDWTQFVDAFQLEQGSTATQYRPYRQIYTDGTVETIKDSLNNTATVEMLLKVGDYQDEQEILSGAVTRNVGIKVLDGTEDWTQGAASPTFKASLLVMDSEHKDRQDMLCSHFKPIKTNVTSAVNDNQCAMFTPGGGVGYDKLVIGKYDMPNLTAWKQWLADQYAAGTPVIVIYPLNASTTDTVSPQKLFKNPVTVTEASIDNLEVTTTEAEHTVPTPDYPLDIACNNGVIKYGQYGKNLFDGVSNLVLGKYIASSTGAISTDSHNFYCETYFEVKPNTSYVFWGEKKADATFSQYNRIHWYNNSKTFISSAQYAQSNKCIGISPNNAKYVRISCNPIDIGTLTQETVDLFNWYLGEGDTTTSYEPYHFGLHADGTQEKITITGKNLFNESHIKSVAINDISVVIPVKQNKTYTWSYNKTEYDFRFDSDFVWGIDLNGSKVENGVTLVYANGTYTTASYVTVTVVSPNVVALQTIFRNNVIQPTKENVLASSMQLEEGIRPTKYEEYYQVSFAPEDLLKLSDYQDVQSVLDGVVTRNVGIKVLDGTENWTRYGTGRFATPLIGSKKQDNQEVPISTHFIGMSANNAPHTDGYVSVFNGSIAPTSGALGINYQATPEVEQFKQWLADQYAAGTPVIVVYPLADTVEETVESRDVFITSGTNTIERNSEYVSSDGITVKYKKLR